MPYARPEDAKAWRQRNKDKLSANHRKYYNKNKEAILAHDRIRRATSEAKRVISKKNHENYQLNRDERLQYAKDRYDRPDVKAAKKEYTKKYYEENKGRWDKYKDDRKQWKIDNRQHRLAQAREYAKKMTILYRDKAVDLLGSLCYECRTTDRDVLQIHHVNGNGKQDKDKKGRGWGYYKYIVEHPEEAKQELRLLCANCHMKVSMRIGTGAYRNNQNV